MAEKRSPEDATLLDILVDGFEKNEIIEGFHLRILPMPDAEAAIRKFTALNAEAERWKGRPEHKEEQPDRRLAVWPDLEIVAAGRGIMLRVRAPRFDEWWHEESTWRGAPLDMIYDWLADRRP